jgi:hypothetical protein
MHVTAKEALLDMKKDITFTVTVQACYSSPWTQMFYLGISETVTDFLASYDLFLVFGQKITAFSYIQFE